MFGSQWYMSAGPSSPDAFALPAQNRARRVHLEPVDVDAVPGGVGAERFDAQHRARQVHEQQQRARVRAPVPEDDVEEHAALERVRADAAARAPRAA